MRRLSWIALLISGAVVSLSQVSTHIVVMHTNDLHGHLLPVDGVGGLAEIASIVNREQPDLLLDAGDIFSGTLVSDSFNGESTIAIMNAMGYAAAALGNHEFDFGQDALRARAQQARFPILSANVESPVSEVDPFSIQNVSGIRFGIIGLTTAELMTTTHARNLNGVRVVDLADAVSRALARIRKDTDFVILLAHLAIPEEEPLVRAFPEIRLLIGGHTDVPTLKPVVVGDSWIHRAGKFGNYIGRVDLEFTGKVLTERTAELIPVQKTEPDPEIAELIAPFNEKVKALMSTVVGDAADDLRKSRQEESALPNLIADAIRAKTGTTIAITNIGGIRADVPKGSISAGKLYEVLPFPNTLVTMQLAGRQIKKLLGIEMVAISGLRVRVNPSKPKGQVFVSASLPDGTELQDGVIYTVTTNDFLLAGGDGFTEFANGLDIRDTGLTIRSAVTEFIQSKKTVEPYLDGRVTVVRQP